VHVTRWFVWVAHRSLDMCASFMGLFSRKWVSFQEYGSLFKNMGLFFMGLFYVETHIHSRHVAARRSLFAYAYFPGNTCRTCIVGVWYSFIGKNTVIQKNWTLLWVSFQMYSSDFGKICRTVVVGFHVMICFSHIYRSLLTFICRTEVSVQLCKSRLANLPHLRRRCL